MLEIEPQLKDKANPASANQLAEHAPVKAPKQIKVIVDNAEFEENLKHHQLKIQQKEIVNQKKVIQSKILRIKREAWFKIGLGVLLVLFVIRRYTTGSSSIKSLGNGEAEQIITTTPFGREDFVVIALILIFIYFAFFGTKKNAKKEKK